MEAKFLSPLDSRDLNDGKDAILLHALRFRSEKLGIVVVAPKGMETDFASIPRGVWNLIPKRGKHDRAAVIHDAAYRGMLQTSHGYTMLVTKRVADNLFDEACKVCEVGWLTRVLMVRAVKLFGRPSHPAPTPGV